MDICSLLDQSDSELINDELILKNVASIFPIRRSKHREIASNAIFKASQENFEVFGPHNWTASSPFGDFISLAVPDTKQERLTALAQLAEVLFLIDGPFRSS